MDFGNRTLSANASPQDSTLVVSSVITAATGMQDSAVGEKLKLFPLMMCLSFQEPR